MKKALLLFIIPIIILSSCKETNAKKLSDADPYEIIDEVYEILAKDTATSAYIPSLITKEITEGNASYYIGSDKVSFRAGAASEGAEQPTLYSFCVVILEDDADFDGQRKMIESGINKSKWVCAEADEAYVVRYENVIAVIMGTKQVCDELEGAFLTVMRGYKN